MRVWDALYFTEGEFQPDATKSADWNRGAYLVQGPAIAAPATRRRPLLGGDKTDRQSARLHAAGLVRARHHRRQQPGPWPVDEADIVAYLKTGHNRFTAATGPMAEEIVNSTSQYDRRRSHGDRDLSEVAAGSVRTMPPPVPADSPAMIAGQAIYRDQCSACHGIDGTGVRDAVSVAGRNRRWRMPAIPTSAIHAGAARRPQRGNHAGADRAGHAVVRLAARTTSRSRRC